MRQHSFAVRYLTLFGGETFSKLCVMAAFAYLAHVLAPADYGTIEWALSVTVFFVLGVESGMGLYGARIVAAMPDRVPQLVPQVMVLRLLLGIPVFIVILVAAARAESPAVGLLAVNGIAVLLTPLLTQWVFQGLRQMHWVAAGTALRNFVFVVLIVALIRAGSDIRLVALSEVAGIAALAIFNSIVLFGVLRVRLDWRDLTAGTARVFRDVWFMGFSDFTWACLWYSPAIILAWLGSGMEQVAWIGASVRIVLALHTFVWLYFFNMLPNMAKEIASGIDGWIDLIARSMAASMWPACLAALGGTLIAPVLVPRIYGEAYQAAVLPFQIVVWMIPVAWFSGHFRFSLIAAGHQRWEFGVSAATAVVTVAGAAIRESGSASR
jgi:O-antigen/teichoic acid export membrane protein